MQRIHVVYDYIMKLRDRQIIVKTFERHEIINRLHRLIPQVTQLQEIIFQMEYTSNVLDRLDFILDDIIECIIVVLKELKGTKQSKRVLLMAS